MGFVLEPMWVRNSAEPKAAISVKTALGADVRAEFLACIV
jgi:hypothetical protein